jgi:hypothetical protein
MYINANNTDRQRTTGMCSTTKNLLLSLLQDLNLAYILKVNEADSTTYVESNHKVLGFSEIRLCE